jgi:hypothetical protein
MGERDELLKLIIDAGLSGGGGSGGGGGGGGGGGDAGDDEATKIVKRVLDLDGDHCGILSLLGTQVTPQTPVNVMRKQYLLLSTKVTKQ